MRFNEQQQIKYKTRNTGFYLTMNCGRLFFLHFSVPINKELTYYRLQTRKMTLATKFEGLKLVC